MQLMYSVEVCHTRPNTRRFQRLGPKYTFKIEYTLQCTNSKTNCNVGDKAARIGAGQVQLLPRLCLCYYYVLLVLIQLLLRLCRSNG